MCYRENIPCNRVDTERDLGHSLDNGTLINHISAKVDHRKDYRDSRA